MMRAAARFIRTVCGLAVLAACPVLTLAQQPQAMCRETLETWVRDKSLNAKWNSDHTAVIMVRGGVDFGPANFYTDTKNFLVTPLELLRAQDPR